MADSSGDIVLPLTPGIPSPIIMSHTVRSIAAIQKAGSPTREAENGVGTITIAQPHPAIPSRCYTMMALHQSVVGGLDNVSIPTTTMSP